MNKGQCQSQGPHKESKSNMRVCLCVSVRTLQEQYVTSAIFQQHGGSHRKACCAFVCVWVQETGNLISSTATRPHSRYSLPPPQKNPLRCYCPQLPDSGRDHNEEEEGNKKPAAWFFFFIIFFFTFANEQYVVVAEAHGTLAAEAPNLVDTHAVGTDSRDLSTLVDICKQHTTEVGGSVDAVR